MQRILFTLGAVLATALLVTQFQGAPTVSKPEIRETPMQTATSTPVATSSKPKMPLKPSGSPKVTTASATTTPMVDTSVWKDAIATVFWVGEDATDDNGFIHNSASAWDGAWMTHFGGVDDPHLRCDWRPCAFMPKENPFYVALPYNDIDDQGVKKADADIIPWNDASQQKSVLKNRWIHVVHAGKSCYGQWEDVGPFFEDDSAYVFGSAAKPKNTYGVSAGIDLSPALRDCLGADGLSDVRWRHVDAGEVPAGPWKTIITTRASQ